MNLLCKQTIGISHEFPTARSCANADDADDASLHDGRGPRAVTPRTVTVRLSYCQSHVRKFCLVRVTGVRGGGACFAVHTLDVSRDGARCPCAAAVESASASFADRTGARFQAVWHDMPDCCLNEVCALPIRFVGSRVRGWPLRPSGIQGQRPKRTALPLSRQRHTCCEHCPPLRIDCHQHGAVDSDIQQIFFSGIRRSCRPLKHIPPRAIHKRGGCPIRSKQQLHFPFPRQNQRKPWMFSR